MWLVNSGSTSSTLKTRWKEEVPRSFVDETRRKNDSLYIVFGQTPLFFSSFPIIDLNPRSEGVTRVSYLSINKLQTIPCIPSGKPSVHYPISNLYYFWIVFSLTVTLLKFLYCPEPTSYTSYLPLDNTLSVGPTDSPTTTVIYYLL